SIRASPTTSRARSEPAGRPRWCFSRPLLERLRLLPVRQIHPDSERHGQRPPWLDLRIVQPQIQKKPERLALVRRQLFTADDARAPLVAVRFGVRKELEASAEIAARAPPAEIARRGHLIRFVAPGRAEI